MSSLQPLYRRSYDAATLLREHPPKLQHGHKQLLFDLAYPKGSSPTGAIEVTRWQQSSVASFPLPAKLPTEVRPDFYDYRPLPDIDATEWHVNFADPRLFVAYGSGLLAQDEMQVAEHPVLASVREALLAEGLIAKTEDESGPTPVLVRDVERAIVLATNVDQAAGRPQGLYGNRFAAAPLDAVRKAVVRIEPPTRSNIIAMAAPSGGRGEYTEKEIEFIFVTAYTAFVAAMQESDRSKPVVVHSGFWGCGAFGGNRKLMIALQSLAARAAGIAKLILHAGDAAGVDDAQWGLDVADSLAGRCGSPCTLSKLSGRASMLSYRWGVSDGN